MGTWWSAALRPRASSTRSPVRGYTARAPTGRALQLNSSYVRPIGPALLGGLLARCTGEGILSPTGRSGEEEWSGELITFEAWTAWSALMARCSVVFAWIQNRETDRVHAGSGVALRTQGGVPFVLTAAHVGERSFKHAPRLALQNGHVGYPMHDFRGIRHPDPQVDVAIVVPPAGTESWAALLQASESLEMVEPAYDQREGDLFTVIGCPAEMLRIESVTPEVGYRTFHWMCDPLEPPVQRDDDMLEFKWTAHGAQLYAMDDPRSPVGAAPDSAGGMSGGPLWRFRSFLQADSDSAPRVVSRIVAVQREYRPASRDIYLDPSERWYPWLLRRAVALDSRG